MEVAFVCLISQPHAVSSLKLVNIKKRIIDVAAAHACQSATLDTRTSLRITWAPVTYTGVQSYDYLGRATFERLIEQYSTHQSVGARHETEKCVCDTGAILSDQQEAVGAADRELGAVDWPSLLSVGPSLCL
ncbi:hypothetical protein CHARACLAT_005700 [Characodon lateralis]|uniref:Uncharacterized protein n=1 Tax=Characodon lateralis TaxID=208331 RepID=A0ABU7CLN4_9TELE|nr:hypothetical protein [Characodon lateralis]